MKKCSTCKETKSLAEFNKNISAKDGLHNQCRSCSRISKSAWKKRNRSKCNAQMRNAYAKDPIKNRARVKTYRQINPGIINAQCMRRHAKKLQRTPKWLTRIQHIEIRQFYIDAKKLQWMSNSTDPFEVDHIVPLQGKNVSGLHVPWNLQILPKSLNLKKGNRV